MNGTLLQADEKLVTRLNRGWARRATVAAMTGLQTDEALLPGCPDYPLRLIPFHDHPAFTALAPALQDSIATWGWIGYNLRTVAAEDHVVNPALGAIAAKLLRQDEWTYQEAVRQTLVDEHYHSYMHLTAVRRTCRLRGMENMLALPQSVTLRRLRSLQMRLAEPWQRSLSAIAFATVAEISVNAYLDILADDAGIQPHNRLIAQQHNRDEHAHSKVLGEIMKLVYSRLTPGQQSFFIETLPTALSAYVAQDFSMWEAILAQLCVPQAEALLAHGQARPSSAVITRDYSGLHRFADELGILTRLDFDFSGTLPSTRTSNCGATEPC